MIVNSQNTEVWKELDFNETQGWPIGSKLYYMCTKCESLVASIPSQAELDFDWECKCGNLYVDEDAGRAGADEPSCVKLLEKLR